MGKGGTPGRTPRAWTAQPPTLSDVRARLRLEGDPPDTAFIFTHQIPPTNEHPRYLITTDPYDLREPAPEVWRERARRLVNAAEEDKGRVLFCINLTDDRKVAAIRFHFEDRGLPLLVLAIAERYDEHRDESEAWVHVLKRYLHLFGLCINSDGTLLYDAPTGEQEARARDPYEFRRAPHERFPRRPGGIALMQDPPADVVPRPTQR